MMPQVIDKDGGGAFNRKKKVFKCHAKDKYSVCSGFLEGRVVKQEIK